MLIASRGFGKSFILSLYAMIRALLIPERKVVVVGAAFRQSRFCSSTWKLSGIMLRYSEVYAMETVGQGEMLTAVLCV